MYFITNTVRPVAKKMLLADLFSQFFYKYSTFFFLIYCCFSFIFSEFKYLSLICNDLQLYNRQIDEFGVLGLTMLDINIKAYYLRLLLI